MSRLIELPAAVNRNLNDREHQGAGTVRRRGGWSAPRSPSLTPRATTRAGVYPARVLRITINRTSQLFVSTTPATTPDNETQASQADQTQGIRARLGDGIVFRL